MTTKGQFSYRDRGSEVGSLMLHFDNVDAGGANYDAVIAAITGIEADILAITLCTSAGYGMQDAIGGDSDTVPTENFAQREIGLRVFLVDDVNGRKSHFTIPGPDLDSLTILDGTDFVDLADASIMATLVAAVEADAQSVDGNAVSVLRAVIVGRRN